MTELPLDWEGEVGYSRDGEVVHLLLRKLRRRKVRSQKMRLRCSLITNFVLILTAFVLMTGAGAKASDKFTVLFDFNYPTGFFPRGNLILDSAGNLYGTTVEGGLESPTCQYLCGIVFELSPLEGAWTYKVLYYFTGGADGSQPHGRLTQDSKGNLYGTAFDGGTVNGTTGSWGEDFGGTLFELSTGTVPLGATNAPPLEKAR
jgi:hypothetical protein